MSFEGSDPFEHLRCWEGKIFLCSSFLLCFVSDFKQTNHIAENLFSKKNQIFLKFCKD